MNNIKLVDHKKKSRWDKMTAWYWPIYRAIRDKIAPVWYSVFGYKHHIIKTSLTPQAWYDTDSRILYGVMECVKWFVENDMRSWSKEDYDAEVKRIEGEMKDSEDLEFHKAELEGIKDQYERDQKICSICEWWNNYAARLEEIEKASSEWYDFLNSFKEKDEAYCFPCKLTSRMNDEEKKKERNLIQKTWDLEEKLDNEEQEMLKDAIDLRGRMWS